MSRCCRRACTRTIQVVLALPVATDRQVVRRLVRSWCSPRDSRTSHADPCQTDPLAEPFGLAAMRRREIVHTFAGCCYESWGCIKRALRDSACCFREFHEDRDREGCAPQHIHECGLDAGLTALIACFGFLVAAIIAEREPTLLPETSQKVHTRSSPICQTPVGGLYDAPPAGEPGSDPLRARLSPSVHRRTDRRAGDGA